MTKDNQSGGRGERNNMATAYGRDNRSRFLFGFIVCVSIFLVASSAYAQSPANAGYTGLWEYPTAEMPGDGRGRFGAVNYAPYSAAYTNLNYLPWMELNLRLTRFGTGPLISDAYGKYKDKAMDLKLLLWEQEGRLPSIAVGATDIMGTKITNAQYAVATYGGRRWSASFGYGTDRLNGFYGGLAWRPSGWLELKAEYSPLDYTGDVAGGKQIMPEKPSSKVNVGAVASTPWGPDVSVSYQRGDEFCFGMSYNYDLNKPIFGGRRIKGPDGEPRLPAWDELGDRGVAASLLEALREYRPAANVTVRANPRKQVLVGYDNIGESSQAICMAHVTAIAALVLPWDTERLTVAVQTMGVPFVRVDIPGSQLADLRLGRLGTQDHRAARVMYVPKGSRYGEIKDETWPVTLTDNPGARERRTLKAMLTHEPRVDRAVDQKIYMSRTSLGASYTERSYEGWEGYLDVRMPLYNDIDLWWEPETNSTTRIWQGVLGGLRNLGAFQKGNLWALAESGWLDSIWFGANAWARCYFQNGQWWLGARLSLVHERDPYAFAALSDRDPGAFHPVDGADSDWWGAWWLQAGYYIPSYDADLQVEAGRYLDGDMGGTLSFTRWWDNLGIGFYIAKTDHLTSGKNYSNAGMYLRIPAESWVGGTSPHTWRQRFTLMSTWRYDAARKPGAHNTPERLWGQLQPVRLRTSLYRALSAMCQAESDYQGTEPPETEGLVKVLTRGSTKPFNGDR
ncbi:MAG: YjbH domain-containing protein [Synergistales bacterium]|nr:YjbH domain-containing protein [Synergistales bacterium]